MDRSKRVTIEDVAEQAGVHASTVSRALSRPDQVAERTRRRVESVVEELGFVPNRSARGLITGRTGNVAVIAPDITNPHFASLVRAAGRAARDRDLQLLLVDTGEHAPEEVRAAQALVPDVDGFVVLSPRRLHRDLDVIAGKDVVFVDRPVRGQSSVVMRAGQATEEALAHLAELGHRTIAYLQGPSASWAAAERTRAVKRASDNAGTEVRLVPSGGPTFEAAVEVVDDVLATGASAVMAFNDQMALGVISSLSARGIAVPGDVSVVGCDDVPMAAMTSPTLTTIRMPVDEAGSRAVHMLNTDRAAETLTGEFVVRSSTGAAR